MDLAKEIAQLEAKYQSPISGKCEGCPSLEGLDDEEARAFAVKCMKERADRYDDCIYEEQEDRE